MRLRPGGRRRCLLSIGRSGFFGPLASSNQTPTCFRSGRFGFGSSLVPDTGSKEVPGPFRFSDWLLVFLHSDFDAGGFVDQCTAVATLFTFCPPGPWAVVIISFTSPDQRSNPLLRVRQHGHGRRGGVDAALGLGGGDAFDLVVPDSNAR